MPKRKINARSLKNLATNSDLTPIQRKVKAVKAGIKSGAVRRHKRLLKELLESLLLEKTTIHDGDRLRQCTNDEAILIAQIVEAKKGNTTATNYITALIEQKPAEKHHISGDVKTSSAIDKKELKAALKEIKPILKDL
jgi:hypothetical protein